MGEQAIISIFHIVPMNTDMIFHSPISWGNSYPWETYITDVNVAKYGSDICLGGTDITREMCSGAHIPQGNTYHCNMGRKMALLLSHTSAFSCLPCGFSHLYESCWSQRHSNRKPGCLNKPQFLRVCGEVIRLLLKSVLHILCVGAIPT